MNQTAYELKRSENGRQTSCNNQTYQRGDNQLSQRRKRTARKITNITDLMARETWRRLTYP